MDFSTPDSIVFYSTFVSCFRQVSFPTFSLVFPNSNLLENVFNNNSLEVIYSPGALRPPTASLLFHEVEQIFNLRFVLLVCAPNSFFAVGRHFRLTESICDREFVNESN